MAWVYIDVPEAEAPLAIQAGAELHRRHKKFFFDSKKVEPSRFARWPRIPDPSRGVVEPGAAARAPDVHSATLSLHEVAVICGVSVKLLRALVDESLFPSPLESSGKTSRADRWAVAQIDQWRQESPIGLAFSKRSSVEAGGLSFVSIAEPAFDAGFQSRKDAFRALRRAGVLIESQDLAQHNAPTCEYFEKGWFARLERYLPAKGEHIYQTVVVGAYRKDVTSLFRSIWAQTEETSR